MSDTERQENTQNNGKNVKFDIQDEFRFLRQDMTAGFGGIYKAIETDRKDQSTFRTDIVKEFARLKQEGEQTAKKESAASTKSHEERRHFSLTRAGKWAAILGPIGGAALAVSLWYLNRTLLSGG